MPIWLDLTSRAYEFAKETGLWDALRARLKRPRKLLLLGASGAGKTQFINSLNNPLSPRLTPRQRTPSVQKRKARVGVVRLALTDTPGQLLDEAKRKPAITEATRTGVEGIIIVCYGYHEAEEAGGIQAVPQSGREVARAGYLRSRRTVELDLLSEWVPRVDHTTTKWVLTVVTKADLWWPDTERRIQEYYGQGEYAQGLQQLTACHYVLPYCSVIEPFYGGRTSGRFGDNERNSLRLHLLESLVRLLGEPD